VREIVIVISDLYLAPSATDSSSSESPHAPLPGFEHAARYGERSALKSGWRPWLAHWLGRDDLAAAAPAAVIAAALTPDPVAPATLAAASPDQMPLAIAPTTPIVAIDRPPPPLTAWVATPVHLIAGLTSLHLDRRSILRLPSQELACFAADFRRTFGESELMLEPTSSGEFLLLIRPIAPTARRARLVTSLDRVAPSGPAKAPTAPIATGPTTPATTQETIAATTEPARAVIGDLEGALPSGPGAANLKRLGAELEMWLHTHTLNEARRRRGELPVSTLWLWGGGALLSTRCSPVSSLSTTSPVTASPPTLATAAPSVALRPPDNVPTELAFGSDAYLNGLWHLHGGETQPLPDELSDVLGYPHYQRAVLVAEVAPMLHANPQWTLFEALAEIDRRFISPALAALRRSDIESLVLIANNTELRVRRNDRLKLWRRPRPGVAAFRA
jgi:hypothetical protein